MESNIRIAQQKAQEQADSDYLDVGEEGFDDDYTLDSMDMPESDRPGEEEWDAELELQSRKKNRKSTSMGPPAGPPETPTRPKNKRGRPAKAKQYVVLNAVIGFVTGLTVS